MLIGTKAIVRGDIRRYTVDFSDFLDKGRTLVTATVTVPVGTNSSVGSITLDAKQHRVYFFVTAGAVNENFTATIQITDTEGQVTHDTINFVVSNP